MTEAAHARCLALLAALGACTVGDPLPSENEDSGDTGMTSMASGDGDGDGDGDSVGDGDGDGDGDTTVGDGDGDGDGCEFICPPDGIEPSCDPFAQDCPEGEKCMPVASQGQATWDANKCVPILGDDGLDDPCMYDGQMVGTDTCGAGLMCWVWDDWHAEPPIDGTCIALCSGTADDPECPEGTSCRLAGDGTLTPCLPTCDPTEQDCHIDLGCYWVGSEFSCAAGGSLELGEACAYVNDCSAGLMCANGDFVPNCQTDGCCAEFCDVDDPMCTDPQTTCVSFWEEGMAPPGYEHVGVCVLPP